VGGHEVSSPTGAEGGRSSCLLLDTHVLVWLASGDSRLGRRAKQAIEKANQESQVLISAITPWEIGLLAAKGRIQLQQDALQWIHAVLSKPGIRLSPLEPEIVVSSTRLPFEMHADPADRILVATARHLNAVLVTADRLLLDLAKKRYFSALNAEK
jgi:PIN domain nuclease of toxin-antitoxin system